MVLKNRPFAVAATVVIGIIILVVMKVAVKILNIYNFGGCI